MRRLLLYGVLGLIGYGVFLLIQLPASQLVGLMSRQVPGLTIQEAQGTAIDGGARGVRWGDRELPDLSWRWRPSGLLSGRLAFRLTAAEPRVDLESIVGINPLRRVRITDLRGAAPLSRVIGLVSRAPLLIEGELELAVQELRLSPTGSPTLLEGLVRLLNVHTSLGRDIALGDFRATFVTHEETISGDVSDLGGPLAFTGNLTLTPDGRYRFTGTLSVRDNNNLDLRQALAFLGRPDANGRWPLDFSGELPR
jgi:general secretion pathway protein N